MTKKLSDYLFSAYNKKNRNSMEFLKARKIQEGRRRTPGRKIPPPPKEGYSGGKRFFEGLVREALKSLPPGLRSRLENVAVVVEEDSRGPGPKSGGQELLGLYHGISKKERGFWYGNVLPDRIVIYQRPLERISSNCEELRENVRQTVFHEVGHYFGFDEGELQELEEE